MKPESSGLVVVFGGASGIGAACCSLMAERGWSVVVVDIEEAAAGAVAQEIGGHAYVADIADADAVERLAADVERTHGPVEALVVSSGAFQERYAPADLPIEVWRRTLDVNLGGPFNAARAFGTRMAARGRGSIVNIGSTAAHGGSPLHAYAPSKAAVLNLTSGLAGQWGRSGVRVNSVSPGPTLVPRVARREPGRYATDVDSHMALGRRIQPREIAEGVEFLASSRASAITGIDLLIDAGFMAASTWGMYGGVPPAQSK